MDWLNGQWNEPLSRQVSAKIFIPLGLRVNIEKERLRVQEKSLHGCAEALLSFNLLTE
jgi:hypothetical protein